MLDHPPQASQPMHNHAGCCSYDDGHVYVHTGSIRLVFSYQEFLALASVVRDTARKLQERILFQRQQTATGSQQRRSFQSLLHSKDPATQLVGVWSLLQTETDPVRIAALRTITRTLDEEVRREVRHCARERAEQARKDEE